MGVAGFIKESVYSSFQLLIFNLLIILLSNISIIGIISTLYTEKTVFDVEHNIIEYEEVDISHICSIVKCTSIKYDGVIYKNTSSFKQSILEESFTDESPELFRFSEHGYLTSDLSIKIKFYDGIEEWKGGWVVVDVSILFKDLRNYLIYIILVIATLNIGLFLSGAYYYRKHMNITLSKARTESYSKNVISLTENIHHELNTPLAVISNKISKLERQFDEFSNPSCSIYTKQENHIEDTKKDFKLINYSISQILDILNAMKQFKVFKKDEDKSIYEIIDVTVNVLQFVQPEKFKYEIDNNLRNYYLNQNYLSSGELTGIILNMCKNSIDAESTFIKFTSLSDGKGFYIADNGNGIHPKIINRIYDEDFTTKKGSYETRGNGLYINKTTLNKSDGRLYLISTSSLGTIFRIMIKTKKISEKN